MEEYIKTEHPDESEIERSADKMLQLLIQPHLYRDISKFIG